MNFWSNNGILTRDFYSSSKNPSFFWHTSWLPSDFDINIEGIPDYKLPQPNREFETDDSSYEEDDNEVLTECEEAVNGNKSDSEGDIDSDSNCFSVMYVAVKKIPLL